MIETGAKTVVVVLGAYTGIKFLPVSLLGGFWVGGTLTQLFFHRFHEPVPPGRAPPPEVSPIKWMSYAIQANPRLAWRELVAMTVFVLAALCVLFRD